jgi:hypothetical protein
MKCQICSDEKTNFLSCTKCKKELCNDCLLNLPSLKYSNQIICPFCRFRTIVPENFRDEMSKQVLNCSVDDFLRYLYEKKIFNTKYCKTLTLIDLYDKNADDNDYMINHIIKQYIKHCGITVMLHRKYFVNLFCVADEIGYYYANKRKINYIQKQTLIKFDKSEKRVILEKLSNESLRTYISKYMYAEVIEYKFNPNHWLISREDLIDFIVDNNSNFFKIINYIANQRNNEIYYNRKMAKYRMEYRLKKFRDLCINLQS